MLKRTMDLLVAGGTLLVFSPLLILLAVMVRQKLGSPMLFRQDRPGRHSRPFMLLEFRTANYMRDERERFLLDAGRIPRLGSAIGYLIARFTQRAYCFNITCQKVLQATLQVGTE
jgi:lipopolysaccharide/colanic/teichoic acid biosynthesis glycosyltransferase